MTPAEINRRRWILCRHIGEEVQLHPAKLKPTDPLRGLHGILRDVKRKRAHVDYGPGVGVWIVPIATIVLPGATVPDPRQKALFDD